VDGGLFCVYDASGELGFISSTCGGEDSAELLRAESHTLPKLMEPGGI